MSEKCSPCSLLKSKSLPLPLYPSRHVDARQCTPDTRQVFDLVPVFGNDGMFIINFTFTTSVFDSQKATSDSGFDYNPTITIAGGDHVEGGH
jgi:hypothetical protein